MIGSPRDTKEYVDFVNWYNEFTSSLMEPLLRLGYAARSVGRKEEATKHLREVYDIEAAAGTISDALFDAESIFYRHLKAISGSADRVDAIVKATVDDFSQRRVSDGDTIASLKRRVSELEARLQRRLSEHNPKCPEVRAKVLGLTGGKCAYCGSAISDQQGDGTGTFAVEHVVPKSCGGPDHLTNFVPACSSCNSQKSAGHVIEFIRKRVGGP